MRSDDPNAKPFPFTFKEGDIIHAFIAPHWYRYDAEKDAFIEQSEYMKTHEYDGEKWVKNRSDKQLNTLGVKPE